MTQQEKAEWLARHALWRLLQNVRHYTVSSPLDTLMWRHPKNWPFNIRVGELTWYYAHLLNDAERKLSAEDCIAGGKLVTRILRPLRVRLEGHFLIHGDPLFPKREGQQNVTYTFGIPRASRFALYVLAVVSKQKEILKP